MSGDRDQFDRSLREKHLLGYWMIPSRSDGYREPQARYAPTSWNWQTLRGALDEATIHITKDEAHDHFKRTVADSKWQTLRGYHVLRHSFISALASEGVDQRVIDEVVGHQSEEQRKRYRHLYPRVMKAAIERVFG